MNKEVKNTSPIKSGTKSLTRRFLGAFPPENNFDKAHLKAYLRGYTRFYFGSTGNWPNSFKKAHDVKQEYFYK